MESSSLFNENQSIEIYKNIINQYEKFKQNKINECIKFPSRKIKTYESRYDEGHKIFYELTRIGINDKLNFEKIADNLAKYVVDGKNADFLVQNIKLKYGVVLVNRRIKKSGIFNLN